MIKNLKENAINKVSYEKLPEEKRKGKIIVGELYKGKRPEYVEEYNRMVESF